MADDLTIKIVVDDSDAKDKIQADDRAMDALGQTAKKTGSFVSDYEKQMRAAVAAHQASTTATDTYANRLSQLQSQLAIAKTNVNDLTKAMADYKGATVIQDVLAPQLAEATARVQGLTAQLKELKDTAAGVKPKLDDMAAGMSAAGKSSVDSMRMIALMSQSGREAATSFQTAGEAGSNFSGMLTSIIERLVIYASVRGVVKAIESTVEFGLELERLSAQTGMSLTAIQQLNYASAATAVPLTAITQAVGQLQRKLELEDGGAVKAIEHLGLNFEAIRHMAPEQQFDVVAKALSGVKDQTEFAGLSAELFSSRSGTAIAAVIKDYDDLKDKAHEANVILGDEQVQALANVAKMWETAKLQAQAYFATIISRAVSQSGEGRTTVPGGLGSQFSPGTTERVVGNQIDEQLSRMGPKVAVPVLPAPSQLTAPAFTDDKQGAARYAVAEQAAKDLTKAVDELIASEKKAATAEAEHQNNLGDYANASKSYSTVLELIGNDLYEGIAADIKRGVSTKALVDVYKTTATVVEDVRASEKEFDKELADQLKQMAENEAETAKFQVGLQKLLVGYDATGKVVMGFTGILHTVDPALIQNAESLVQMQQRLKETEDAFKKTFGAFADLSLGPVAGLQPSGAVADALNNTDHMTHKLELDLDAVSRAFEHIGLSANSGLGQAVNQFMQLFKIIERANAEFDKVQTKYGASSDEAAAAANLRNKQIGYAAVGTGANLVAQGIDSGGGASTGSLVAKYGLEGVSAGSVGGPWGMLVGGVAGAAYGWYESGKEWRKAVSDVARDFGGLHIPDDFAKTIEDIESTTGLQRTQALTTQLAKLIEIAGGLNPANFDTFFNKLHDAYSYLQQGSMTAAQVTQVVDSTFADFAKAGTDAYGRVSDKIKELITLNERFGTESQAIADWMTGQAANAASGLSDLLNEPMIAATGVVGQSVTDAQAAVDAGKKAQQDVVDSLMKDSPTTKALQAAQDAAMAAVGKNVATAQLAVIKAFQAQQDAIKAATTGSQDYQDATKTLSDAQDVLTAALTAQHQEADRDKQALADLGTIAVGAFNSGIAAGQTFVQALQNISPQLTIIQKAFKDLGLDIEDATLKGLTLENTILNGTADAPSKLGQAIGGLEGGITAGVNLGPTVENAATFAAQQATLASLYTQAQAASANAGTTGPAGTAASLLPFQQTLHELQDWATKNGLQLSADTQEKIRQSQELNIWNDDYKSDSEKNRDSMDYLVQSNTALAAAIGGLPAALAAVIAGRTPGPSTPEPPPGTGQGNPTGDHKGNGLIDVPAFATEAYVRRPTLAMVGDAVGGEFVLTPATVASWMSTAAMQGVIGASTPRFTTQPVPVPGQPSVIGGTVETSNGRIGAVTMNLSPTIYLTSDDTKDPDRVLAIMERGLTLDTGGIRTKMGTLAVKAVTDAGLVRQQGQWRNSSA